MDSKTDTTKVRRKGREEKPQKKEEKNEPANGSPEDPKGCETFWNQGKDPRSLMIYIHIISRSGSIPAAS